MKVLGKTPPVRPGCAAEREQLKETLRGALNDKVNVRGTPNQIRARWRAADNALAASTRVKDNQPTDCDDAWESASEYVLGE